MAEDRCALDVVFMQNQDKHFLLLHGFLKTVNITKLFSLLANAHPDHLKHQPLKE